MLYSSVNTRIGAELGLTDTAVTQLVAVGGFDMDILKAARKNGAQLFCVLSALLLVAFGLYIPGCVVALLAGCLLVRAGAAQLQTDAENKGKMVFLAKMSHEIRTPMNAIIGMTEIALSKDPPPDMAEDLINIKHAGSSLLTIINDILDFSKLESGKFTITPDNFRLVSLIDDVVSVMRVRFVGKPVRFVVNADAALPAVLQGDAMRIKQVLINLLNNAAKFTDEGFVALTIDGTFLDDSIAIQFEVADSGIGISEDDIKRIFGTFVQGESARKRSIEGAGLGLDISMQIATLMNGTIDVHSEYGSGSSFTFRLPLAVVSDEPLAEVENAAAIRVLLFERRTVYSDSIMRIIENLGATCISVNDVGTLIETMHAQRFDFIFASSFFIDIIERAVRETDADAILVFMIKEFFEVVDLPGAETIEVPVHCVSIANVLNRRAVTRAAPRMRDELASDGPTASVLVVDDIAINLKVATGLMLRYGLNIDTCLSGAEAIERVQKKEYDIVFMDYMMPEMDGLQATEEIRKLGGRYETLPIVALTANAVGGAKETFLNSGMNDFLAKPIESAELARVLEKWIPSKSPGLSEAHTAETARTRVILIDGIDVPRGIHLAGGQLSDYIDNLTVFCDVCVETFTALRDCLAQKDLARFKIHVHGLKGASANIGAAHLSRLALQMESAAAQNDINHIERNFSAFERDFARVLAAIRDTIARESPRSGGTAAGSRNQKSLLLALKDALERMDALTIDRTIKALGELALDGRQSVRVKQITEAVLSFDYDTAIAVIGELLQNEREAVYGSAKR